MLRVFGFISEKIWPEKKNTFKARLADIQYNDNLIPEYFLCPVTFCIMEKPMIVNDHQVHTFDELTLNTYLRDNPGQDPLFTPISTIGYEYYFIPVKNIKVNTERLELIEKFVSLLEEIDKLEKFLKIDITNLNNVMQDTQLSEEKVKLLKEEFKIEYEKNIKISPKQLELLIYEQRKEHEKYILPTKLKLIEELQTFIVFVESVIQSEDKKEHDKLTEIKTINKHPRKRLEELEKEVQLDREKKLQIIPHQDSHLLLQSMFNKYQLKKKTERNFIHFNRNRLGMMRK